MPSLMYDISLVNYSFSILISLVSIVLTPIHQYEALRLNITSIQHHSNSSTLNYPRNHRMTTSDYNETTASATILRPQLALQIYAGSAPAQPAAAATTTLAKHLLLSTGGQQNDHHHHHQQLNQTKRSMKNSLSLLSLASNQGKITFSPRTMSSKQMNNDNDDSSWQYDTGGGGHTSSASELQANGPAPLINAIITLPGGSHQATKLPGSPQMLTNQGEDHERQLQNLTSSALNVERVISRLLDSQASGNIEFSMNMNGDEIVINPISKHGGSILPSLMGNEHEGRIQDDELGVGGFNPRLNRRFARLGRNQNNNNNNNNNNNDGQYFNYDSSELANRALKRHIESELAGDEQSASEIDMIDGSVGGRDESSNYIGGPDNLDYPDMDPAEGSRQQVSASESKDQQDATGRLRDYETGDGDSAAPPPAAANKPNKSINKSFYLPGRAAVTSRAADSGEGDGQDEDQAPSDAEISSSYHDQNNGRASRHNNNNNNNNARLARNDDLDEDIGTRPPRASNSRIGSNTNRSRRKTAASRRRANHFRDQSSESPASSGGGGAGELRNSRPTQQQLRGQHQRGQASVSNDVSTLVIKGEDVKKFEQLLENLRSLSINSGIGNQDKAPSKRSSASHHHHHHHHPSGSRGVSSSRQREQQQQNDIDDEDDGSSKQQRQPGDDYATHQVEPNNGGRQRKTLSSSGHQKEQQPPLAKGSMPTRSFDIECDRHRRQQRLQKAASSSGHDATSSGGEPPASSSPNLVDNDPITSSDGASDELNDESSQNIEQEIDGFDDVAATNRVDLVGGKNSDINSDGDPKSGRKSSPSSSDGAKEGEQETDDVSETEEPRSMFVRKTILQTYYDNRPATNETISWDNSNSADQGTNNNNNGGKQRPDRSSSVMEQKSNDRRPSSSSSDQQQQQQHQHLDSKDGQSSPNAYIDYDRLDDRNVYRAGETDKNSRLGAMLKQ